MDIKLKDITPRELSRLITAGVFTGFLLAGFVVGLLGGLAYLVVVQSR